MKQGKFDKATDILRKILTCNSTVEVGDVANLAECLIILQQYDEYQKLYAEHKQSLDTLNDGNFVTLMNTLKAIQENDTAAIKAQLQPLIAKTPPGMHSKLVHWQFNEIQNGIIDKLSDDRRQLAETIVGFFSGRIDPQFMQSTLDQV
ncbi:tetratricopeptide repeat protein [Undibacterium aquatile]|uniref:Uncharacterized protein n=1 Tax=Undibacterium aquatile TaxID=1537398 RepID=A0ABR6XIK8_9BURK|nr:hypothetical protein [Undibacterium aquatile]MBC3812734.1 hypothetical protein [Undibacterium aquatile]